MNDYFDSDQDGDDFVDAALTLLFAFGVVAFVVLIGLLLS